MITSLPERLPDTDAGHARAADILRAGGLVAFPTETVYGLGGDACDDRAVARIFEAKGRPSFNPLIVHFANLDTLKSHVHWTPEAELLAQAFWPGPLTLVLRKQADSPISPLVSAVQPSRFFFLLSPDYTFFSYFSSCPVSPRLHFGRASKVMLPESFRGWTAPCFSSCSPAREFQDAASLPS